jgi:hypothetical protein
LDELVGLRALGTDRLASQMYGRGIISHLTCAIIPKSGARRAGASAPPSGETISAWSRCMSEIRVHFSDSALEAPLTGLPPDIAESCHLFRMAIKNLNQADGSFAGLHCTTLILLERSPSAANDPTRLFLGEAKLLAHGLDPCRISRSQLEIGLILSLEVQRPNGWNRHRPSGYQPCDILHLVTRIRRKPFVHGRRGAGVCRYQDGVVNWATGHQYTFKVYFGQGISRRCGASF